jgi:SOS response regulatory protein OraA/RecX
VRNVFEEFQQTPLIDDAEVARQFFEQRQKDLEDNSW